MSLPSEQLETLLNEYLDGELDGDVLAKVERILGEDPDAASLLDQLRQQRAARIDAMRNDPLVRRHRLPDDFSQRVLAAIEAERQPSVTTNPSPRRWQAAATAALALAASLLLVVLLRSDSSDVDTVAVQPAEDSVADHPAADAPSNKADDSSAADPGARPEAAMVTDTDKQNRLPAASRSPEANLAIDSDRQPGTSTAETEDEMTAGAPDPASAIAASGSPGTANPPRSAADRKSKPNDEAMPSTDPLVATDRSDDPAREPMLEGRPLRMLLVYEVERTAAGRATNCVFEGLREAGIAIKQQQPVDEQVLDHLHDARMVSKEASSPEADDTRILFLAASAGSLDRFMLAMFDDTENIATIRWNAATDAPLLAAAERLRSAARAQQQPQQSAAWPLAPAANNDDQRNEDRNVRFAVPRDGRMLLPLQRDTWEQSGSALAGGEELSHLLLLIR